MTDLAPEFQFKTKNNEVEEIVEYVAMFVTKHPGTGKFSTHTRMLCCKEHGYQSGSTESVGTKEEAMRALIKWLYTMTAAMSVLAKAKA